MHTRMLNSRDSRGAGYVLAIVGVAAVLAVLLSPNAWHPTPRGARLERTVRLG